MKKKRKLKKIKSSNVSSKDRFNNDEIVSMNDVINATNLDTQQALIQSQLAESKESRCTFSDGYITQVIYSCKTCSEIVNKPVAICFGCSLNCHLDHDVVEIYVKRDIRCDCGTLNLQNVGLNCMLDPTNKTIINDKNQYNHNYQGLYCICKQPYNPHKDIMYQCISCEDWFHLKCLILDENDPKIDKNEPKDSNQEFICKSCCNQVKNIIFWQYYQYHFKFLNKEEVVLKKEEEEEKRKRRRERKRNRKSRREK